MESIYGQFSDDDDAKERISRTLLMFVLFQLCYMRNCVCVVVKISFTMIYPLNGHHMILVV